MDIRFPERPGSEEVSCYTSPADHHTPISMFRSLLVLLFIVANLSGQVSVAYACTMGDGAPKVMRHCCCKKAEIRAAHDAGEMIKVCCQVVVDVSPGPGQQVGHVQPEPKLPDLSPNLLSPVLLPALCSLVLEPASPGAFWNARQDTALSEPNLYLRTQRLRL